MAKSRENGSTILLGLEGYEVGKVIGEERGIVVKVETELKKQACLCCNSSKLYRHGRAKKMRAFHGWSQGKKVYIEVARHRWRCRGCGYSFTEGIGLVRPHSRLTRQAGAEALLQTRYLGFSQVGRNRQIKYPKILLKGQNPEG